MRAEESTTLAADFAGIATELGITKLDTRDQDATVKAVLRWLRENSRWLLIFDNASEARQVAKYLPQSVNGHVLITSRNRHWRQYAQPLVVEVMTPGEAIKFLLSQTGQTDEAAAGELVHELGYLPLALAQASAYIDQKEKSLADYLPLVQQYRDRVLTPSDDYPASLAATWELSFEAVREHSVAASDLLNLCAFFAPEDIPLDLIVAGAEYLPNSLKNVLLEPLQRDDIVGELGNYSLVEVDRDKYTVSVHRLVQAVVRDNLSAEARQKWTEIALGVVTFGFKYDREDMSTWPIAATVLPHAAAVIASPNFQKSITLEVGELLSGLLYQVGLYLKNRAQYTDARDHLVRALTIAETGYGSQNTIVARILNDLGLVLNDLGDLKGARSNLERALAIDESVSGPDHHNTAISLNDLSLVLHDLGDLQGARSNLERAIAIREAIYGPIHPHVAISLDNLGLVLQELGDLKGARSNLERALAIREAVYGPVHPHVAMSSNNLGSVLQNLGDLKGARSKFERSRAINEAAYGPIHPYVATNWCNLGLVLKDLGDLKTGHLYVKRALTIAEAVYGSDHPAVAHCLGSLGTVFMHEGNFVQAQSYFDRSHRMFLRYFGPQHRKTRHAKRQAKLIRQLRKGRDL
jgi:tetratricopeptide (TPR) repeat protein